MQKLRNNGVRMKYPYFRRLLAGLTAVLMAVSVPVQASDYSLSIFRRIGQHSLTAADLFPHPYGAKTIADDISPKLTQGQRDATVLSLFAEADNFKEATKPFIKDQAWTDLELFANDSGVSVFSKIDRTTTTFGKQMLAEMVVVEEDHDNMHERKLEYERKQRIIKTLIDDEELFNTLDQALKSIKEAEQMMLIFFLNENSARQQILSRYYTDQSVYLLLNTVSSAVNVENSEEKSREVVHTLNKSPNILLTTNLLDKFLFYMSAFHLINVAVMNGKEVWGAGKKAKAGWPGFKTSVKNAPTTVPAKIKGWWNTAKHPSTWLDKSNEIDPNNNAQPQPQAQAQARTGLAWKTWGSLVVVGAGLYRAHAFLDHLGTTIQTVTELPRAPFKWYDGAKSMVTIQKTLQSDLIKLALVIEHIKSVGKNLGKEASLVRLLPEGNAFFHMFDSHQERSADMEDLFKLLNTSTFKGSPSFFSHQGRILAVNTLMNSTKADWAEIFKAIGHIDAYVSLAKLVKEFKDKEVTYCFPEYVELDTPYLSMTEFWNPQIDPSKVVTNDLNIDKYMRNLFITGPNMGGKSTVIKAVGINIVLSRLGIAAARRMVLTPFAALNICRYVKEDTNQDLSHFGMEATTAKNLVEQARSLPAHEFSCTILDEFLRGTTSEVATDAAELFSTQMARIPNSVCIYVTHNLEITRLGEGPNKIFDNFQVGLDALPDGSLRRTYKILPGVVSPEIMKRAGQEILRETGLLSMAAPVA